ncbi:MAG: hypothetical protein M3348_01700 [Acidobacteriota bacterium]|nr:hypothetical protein [Acidobacteriota bacterium]
MNTELKGIILTGDGVLRGIITSDYFGTMSTSDGCKGITMPGDGVCKGVIIGSSD